LASHDPIVPPAALEHVGLALGQMIKDVATDLAGRSLDGRQIAVGQNFLTRQNRHATPSHTGTVANRIVKPWQGESSHYMIVRRPYWSICARTASHIIVSSYHWNSLDRNSASNRRKHMAFGAVFHLIVRWHDDCGGVFFRPSVHLHTMRGQARVTP
jgi:hypothetical protein